MHRLFPLWTSLFLLKNVFYVTLGVILRAVAHAPYRASGLAGVPTPQSFMEWSGLSS